MNTPNPMMCRAAIVTNIELTRSRSLGLSSFATCTMRFIDNSFWVALIDRMKRSTGYWMCRGSGGESPTSRNCAGRRLAHLFGAAAAETNDWEVDEARPVAELALDQLTHRVELLRHDRSVLRAALTSEVLALTGDSQRMQSGAVPEVNVSNQPDVLERLQVAVDRSDVRGGHAPADAFGYLLRRHRPVRGEQRLKHEPARGRHAQP